MASFSDFSVAFAACVAAFCGFLRLSVAFTGFCGFQWLSEALSCFYSFLAFGFSIAFQQLFDCFLAAFQWLFRGFSSLLGGFLALLDSGLLWLFDFCDFCGLSLSWLLWLLRFGGFVSSVVSFCGLKLQNFYGFCGTYESYESLAPNFANTEETRHF